VDEVCRKVGISQATYYPWKWKYSGVGASELRELRQLREENGRPKRLVASEYGPADPAGDCLEKCMVRRVTASEK
jgi:Transposase